MGFKPVTPLLWIRALIHNQGVTGLNPTLTEVQTTTLSLYIIAAMIYFLPYSLIFQFPILSFILYPFFHEISLWDFSMVLIFVFCSNLLHNLFVLPLNSCRKLSRALVPLSMEQWVSLIKLQMELLLCLSKSFTLELMQLREGENYLIFLFVIFHTKFCLFIIDNNL